MMSPADLGGIIAEWTPQISRPCATVPLLIMWNTIDVCGLCTVVSASAQVEFFSVTLTWNVCPKAGTERTATAASAVSAAAMVRACIAFPPVGGRDSFPPATPDKPRRMRGGRRTAHPGESDGLGARRRGGGRALHARLDPLELFLRAFADPAPEPLARRHHPPDADEQQHRADGDPPVVHDPP